MDNRGKGGARGSSGPELEALDLDPELSGSLIKESSLHLQRSETYAQFVDAPVKFHKDKKLWKNLAAVYPIFRANGTVVRDSDEKVIGYLKEHNFNADAGLSDQERADVLAYSALMEEKLLPAVLYLWWVDSKNHVEFSRPWYAKAFHFPFNYFLPGRIHRAAEERIECTRGGTHVLPQELRTKVIQDAKDCFDLLSEKLSDQQYFFGESPSSLDALVFSYLAPILRVPFPSNDLKDHLKQSENLWMYCSRILQRFFPSSPEDEVEKKRQGTAREEPSNLDEDPHKIRNIVLSVSFAICALVGYSLMSGLVQVEISGHEAEDPEDGEMP